MAAGHRSPTSVHSALRACVAHAYSFGRPPCCMDCLWFVCCLCGPELDCTSFSAPSPIASTTSPVATCVDNEATVTSSRFSAQLHTLTSSLLLARAAARHTHLQADRLASSATQPPSCRRRKTCGRPGKPRTSGSKHAEPSQAAAPLVAPASTRELADPCQVQFSNLCDFEYRCEKFGPTRNIDLPIG